MAPIRPSTTGEREAGFTLTELLVVLAIVGLILTAIPVLLSSALPGAKSLAATREIANALRAARGRAIASGAATAIRFDAAKQIFRIEPGDAPHHLDGAAFALPGNRSQIAFYPDGSSTGGVVVVGQNTAKHRIAVDWLTGRVGVDE